MRWVRIILVRDWMRGEGYRLYINLIERVDLMTKLSDEGRLILVGLGVEVVFRTPWGLRGPRAQISYDDRMGWRAPVAIYIRSDADEIAMRLAA